MTVNTCYIYIYIGGNEYVDLKQSHREFFIVVFRFTWKSIDVIIKVWYQLKTIVFDFLTTHLRPHQHQLHTYMYHWKLRKSVFTMWL